MGTRVEDLVVDRRTITVTFGDRSVEVTYAPGGWSIADNERQIKGGKDARSDSEVVERLLVEWDMTRDGEPVPPTAEGIASLPLPVVNRISWALFLDVNSGKVLVSPPANGSSPTGSSETSETSQQSDSSPDSETPPAS